MDVPFDNPMICDANIDFGYEDSIFTMVGGIVDNFMSLGYVSGYNKSLYPYCMYLVDAHRKLVIFLWHLVY